MGWGVLALVPQPGKECTPMFWWILIVVAVSMLGTWIMVENQKISRHCSAKRQASRGGRQRLFKSFVAELRQAIFEFNSCGLDQDQLVKKVEGKDYLQTYFRLPDSDWAVFKKITRWWNIRTA